MDFKMWFLVNLQLVAVHLCGTCIVSDFLVSYNHVILSGLVEIWLYNVDVLLKAWWTRIFPIFYLWGAKTWTSVLGLKSRLLVIVRPRRRKRLGKPHSSWTNREMFKDTSLRESSSSDLTNINKMNFVLTWVTF